MKRFCLHGRALKINKAHSTWRSLSILFLLLLAVGSSCGPSQPVKQPPTVPVTVYEVKPQTIPAVFDYVGFAESSHPVEIRARVEGYLDKIAYVEGSFVHAGDLLFQLDPKPFIAKLEEAKGMLAQEQAILWNAKTTTDRLLPLYKQNAISKRDLDNAIATQLASEAKVQSAQAQVTYAQINLDYTTMTSPVNGLSGKARFREGSLITTGANSSDLTTVSVVDPMWVYFSVPETDILAARVQASKDQLLLPESMNFDVRIILGDGSTYPLLGKVDFSAPTINQQTGTMEVRAVFSNPDAVLKPGQFLKARVLGAVRPNAIVVPQTAVLQGSKSMYVYLVKGDQVVVTDIEVGEWFGNYWIVTSGLMEGDQVVSQGINKLQSGSKVVVTGTEKYEAPTTQEQMTPMKNYGV